MFGQSPCLPRNRNARITHRRTKRLAVVGAGPAGLAFAVTAARRGHQVTLFDAAAEIGGQFNIAKQIPGKEEFYETLRYFRRQLVLNGVTLQLNTLVQVKQLAEFDEVILACGIQPRLPCINGIDHPKVLTYLDVLRDKNQSANVWRLSVPVGLVLILRNISASLVIVPVSIAQPSVPNGVLIKI